MHTDHCEWEMDIVGIKYSPEQASSCKEGKERKFRRIDNFEWDWCYADDVG